MAIGEGLRMNGYAVLEARDGDEAVRHSERHSGPIHLLLTDVVMPRMSGIEVARRLASSRPGLKVLYTSGYADPSSVCLAGLDIAVAYLQKPFTLEALAHKVRELLEAGTARDRSANGR